MFNLANNEQIGAYLKRAISEKGFRSGRQFGKRCLEERNLPTDNEEQRKMSNRLSQILNGKKSIQLEDLPVFSKLLDMSCEEILSAGKCFSTSSSHITNYSIAMSKNIEEWEDYIKREDQLILNADEYGKTIIDYALDFKNYELLKYLIKNKYIWFVGTDEKDLFYNFGAGTSIKRNDFFINNLGVLDEKMQQQYELRIKMIILAITHGDTQMLTELRAREIPTLHQVCTYSCSPLMCEKYFDSDLLDSLTNASDEILEYFSEEFEITDRIGITNRFIFPFTSRLIDNLIKTNNDYVQWILRSAIEHNKYALNRLTELLNISVSEYKNTYNISLEKNKEDISRVILGDITYYDNGDIISYRTLNVTDGIITNLVKVDTTSNNIQVKRLIQEVNKIYNAITNITLNI